MTLPRGNVLGVRRAEGTAAASVKRGKQRAKHLSGKQTKKKKRTRTRDNGKGIKKLRKNQQERSTKRSKKKKENVSRRGCEHRALDGASELADAADGVGALLAGEEGGDVHDGERELLERGVLLCGVGERGEALEADVVLVVDDAGERGVELERAREGERARRAEHVARDVEAREARVVDERLEQRHDGAAELLRRLGPAGHLERLERAVGAHELAQRAHGLGARALAVDAEDGAVDEQVAHVRVEREALREVEHAVVAEVRVAEVERLDRLRLGHRLVQQAQRRGVAAKAVVAQARRDERAGRAERQELHERRRARHAARQVELVELAQDEEQLRHRQHLRRREAQARHVERAQLRAALAQHEQERVQLGARHPRPREVQALQHTACRAQPADELRARIANLVVGKVE